MMYRPLAALALIIAFIAVTSPQQAGAVAASLSKPPNNLGLVGYWPLNEATSTQAGDYSGNGSTGTLSGSTLPTWVAGRAGSGLSFNGTTAYVSLGNRSVLKANACTLSFWVKTTTDTDTSPFSGTEAATGNGWAIELGGSATGNLTNELISIFQDTGEVVGYTTATRSELFDGRWHHIVITASGSANSTKIYLDGTAKTVTVPFTDPGHCTGQDAAIDTFALGAETISGSPSIFFSGTLDDVRFYSRVLSPTEVTALYARGSTAGARINASSKTLQIGTSLGTGLSGFWTLDGADVIWTSATAGTARDSSGNGRSLTLNSMNRGTSVTPGKLGQGLTFNGSSSSLSTSLNLSSFITASNATIAVWIKPTGTPSGTQIVITDDTFEDVTIVRDDASTFSVNNWDGAGYDTVSIPYTNNEWMHIVLVHTGGTLYAYKNGSIVGSVASGNTTNLADPLIVGASNATAYFNGSMDEIRTYTRGLSAAEVKQLYLLGAMKIRP